MAERDAIGVGLSLVSTLCAAGGYALQKLAHMRHKSQRAQPGSGGRSLYLSRLWLLGLLSMATSAALTVVASSYLDQSKGAALGALVIIYNTLFAVFLLGETLLVIDILSSAVIIGGTVLAMSAADAQSAQLSFEQVLGLLDDTLVIAYTAILVPILLFVALFVELTVRRPPSTWSVPRGNLLAMCAPVLAGFVQGYTGYGAKAITTVFSGPGGSNSVSESFSHGPVYGYCVLTTVTVVVHLRYLNKGLSFFSQLSVIPKFQAAIIFSNALAGIVYYHDMRDASAGRIIMFGSGFAITVGGVLLLLLKASTEEPAQTTAAFDGAEQAEGEHLSLLAASNHLTGPGEEDPTMLMAAKSALKIAMRKSGLKRRWYLQPVRELFKGCSCRCRCCRR
jgi:hypothetical protein